MHQTSNEVYQNELRVKACRKLAKWFYDAGIPCNATNFDSFAKMVEAVGEHGLGMKPPIVRELRGPLLNRAVDDIQKNVNEHKKEWAQNGCSILLDGWRDNVANKDFVNFVVNSQKGSVFVKSMDISDVAKTANLLFLALDKLVDEVGEENVVQVVTDNSPAYNMAGKLLEVRRPHLYWTPCAAQCIELMLEDIGKQIAPVNNALRKGMFLNGHICTDVDLQNLMMTFTNQLNFHSPAITRFATSFVTLSQIHKQKDNLLKMINSEEWKSSKWTKERMGKKFQSYLLQESFWKNVDYSLKLTDPLIEVLRLVVGERKSAMGYIYHAMVRAKDTISKSFPSMEKYYKKAFEIIDHRWDCQLNRPLHIAGYYLNPEYFYENVSDVSSEKVRKGLYSCIERLVRDLQIWEKIKQELATYQNAERLFGRNATIRQKIMAPADWWALFGSSAPNLQKFAMRVLSLNCSAISCGRNWGVIQDLHTKKRSSLAQATMNDMVYVKFNRALDRRHKRKEIDDPICNCDVPSI